MTETTLVEADEFAAFVGIDWADQRHAWALQLPNTNSVEHGNLEHKPDAVDVWATDLARRFHGRPVAVALEQSRGALLFMLTKYAHLVLFPVHPTTLVNYRRGFRPSGAKSDPSDASLVLDLMVHHREKLRRLHPDTPEIRTLQFLVEERRKFVADKTRCSNRLTAHLKMYFPQVLNWFSEISSEIAGDFLQRWPTLEKAQKARPDTLRRFFIEHHSCDVQAINGRIEEIGKSMPATHDTAVTQSCSSAVLALIAVLREIRNAIASYDKQIETLARQHPEFALVDSLPGAGAALTPRLIAALGTLRERYSSASDLQAYSGIAPVLASSGKQRWVHYRWACPKFLRQTFHEWALHSIRSSVWAKAFYDQQRARGKSRHSIVRALAFKWIRILFRCWKDKTPYDENRYMQVLERRRKSPAAAASLPVELQWKTSAGFSKIALATG